MVALSFPTTHFKPYSTLMGRCAVDRARKQGDLAHSTSWCRPPGRRLSPGLLDPARRGGSRRCHPGSFGCVAYLKPGTFHGRTFPALDAEDHHHYCLDQIRHQKIRPTTSLEEYSQDGERNRELAAPDRPCSVHRRSQSNAPTRKLPFWTASMRLPSEYG